MANFTATFNQNKDFFKEMLTQQILTHPTLSYPDSKKGRWEEVEGREVEREINISCLNSSMMSTAIKSMWSVTLPFSYAFGAPVANSHSVAGLEASGGWGVEQCTVPHMQDLSCLPLHTHISCFEAVPFSPVFNNHL